MQLVMFETKSLLSQIHMKTNCTVYDINIFYLFIYLYLLFIYVFVVSLICINMDFFYNIYAKCSQRSQRSLVTRIHGQMWLYNKAVAKNNKRP